MCIRDSTGAGTSDYVGDTCAPYLRHAGDTKLYDFKPIATTEIYTLSLHDALPIYELVRTEGVKAGAAVGAHEGRHLHAAQDVYKRQGLDGAVGKGLELALEQIGAGKEAGAHDGVVEIGRAHV